jgi:curved DNA-binding protein CbpA
MTSSHSDRLAEARAGNPPPGSRCCDRPGCDQQGLYPAPKARHRLRDYFWFCLDHVRLYNQSWDYYSGMSPEQIEAELRSDTTWNRPTRPMGDWRVRERKLRDSIFGDGDFAFGGGWSEGGGPRPADPGQTPEEEAVRILELEPGVSFDQIKARYRELAKANHPDANGGDKAAEERLKRINQAYTTLKAFFGR